MKKSSLAISIIVVLGVAWVGASWYSGRLIEEKMGDLVNNANTQIKSHLPKADITISYQNYHRGLFSSSLNYIVKVGNEHSFTFDEMIKHGPFTQGLNLGVASLHTTLASTPETKTIFDLTKGQSPFEATTLVSFSGATNSHLVLIPLEIHTPETNVSFSGATLDAVLARDLSYGTLKLKSDNLLINKTTGNKENFSVQGLSLASDTKNSKFDIGLGSVEFGVQKMTFSAAEESGTPPIEIEGFNISSQSSEEDSQNISVNANYSIDSLQVKDQDIGSGKLIMKLAGLDGDALKQFAEQYNAQVMRIFQGSENDIDHFDQEMGSLLAQNMTRLLQGNPTLSIEPLSWKNSKGESSFTLYLALTNPPTVQATDPVTTLSNTLKKLDANLTIPMAMATETATQMALLQGAPAADAEKAATKQVNTLSSLGQMLTLTQVKDDAIVSQLSYADGKVNFNGEQMTLPELLMKFSQMSHSNDQPEGQTPESPAPEGQTPESQAPENQTPDSQIPESPAPENQTPENQAPKNQPTPPGDNQTAPAPDVQETAPVTH